MKSAPPGDSEVLVGQTEISDVESPAESCV